MTGCSCSPGDSGAGGNYPQDPDLDLCCEVHGIETAGCLCEWADIDEGTISGDSNCPKHGDLYEPTGA